MAEIAIQRLALTLSGGSPADAERLVALVAQALAEAALPAGTAQEFGRLQVNVAAEPGEDQDGLARRIAAQIMRQLETVG